jgi:hypothetical protein
MTKVVIVDVPAFSSGLVCDLFFFLFGFVCFSGNFIFPLPYFFLSRVLSQASYAIVDLSKADQRQPRSRRRALVVGFELKPTVSALQLLLLSLLHDFNVDRFKREDVPNVHMLVLSVTTNTSNCLGHACVPVMLRLCEKRCKKYDMVCTL